MSEATALTTVPQQRSHKLWQDFEAFTRPCLLSIQADSCLGLDDEFESRRQVTRWKFFNINLCRKTALLLAKKKIKIEAEDDPYFCTLI